MQCQKQGEESPIRGQPFKISDITKEKKFGIVATDLKDLINKGCKKLNIPSGTQVRVVLEQDGTEVEDEDYFSTLENNTELMILIEDQKWLPSTISSDYKIFVDEPDGDGTSRSLKAILGTLRSDVTTMTLLHGHELELLADMDPDNLADLLPGNNREFLRSIKEAASRYLSEKRQAKEAMELLKYYHCRHVTNQSSENTTF